MAARPLTIKEWGGGGKENSAPRSETRGQQTQSIQPALINRVYRLNPTSNGPRFHLFSTVILTAGHYMPSEPAPESGFQTCYQNCAVAPSHRIRNRSRILSQTSIRVKFRNEDDIFAISLAKPFAFALRIPSRRLIRSFLLRFGGEILLPCQNSHSHSQPYRCDCSALNTRDSCPLVRDL